MSVVRDEGWLERQLAAVERWLRGWILLACIGPWACSGSEAAPGIRRLLEPEPVAPAMRRVPGGLGTGGVAVRAAWDQEPASWRAGDRWNVPLPDGRSATVSVREVQLGETGVVLVRGRVEGDPRSDVWMTFCEGRMAGTLRRGSGSRVVVSPEAGGGQWIRDVREAGEGLCGNGGAAGWGGEAADAEVFRRALRKAGLAGGGTSTNEVDLLLGYTPAAANGAGGEAGIRVLLELSVAEANDAFERSAIRVRLRTVGVMAVEYAESGDLATDLTRLTRGTDGWMDVMHRLRDVHAADLVCLVTEFENSNQYAGMANQLRALDTLVLERGFTVCLRPYLLGNYTLAHELGHLFGGNHDRETSPEGGLQTSAYGARFLVDGQTYRTVMAYRPGIQVPHFSNPDVAYRGVPTGTGGVADNAGTLNLVGPWVARVREPAGRVGFASATHVTSEPTGVVRVRLARTGILTAGTVRVRTMDGSGRAGVDYEGLDAVIALPAGGMEAEVSVTLRETAARDGDRRFTLVLSEPSAGLAVGPEAVMAVTLRDDDREAGVLLDTSFRARPGADYWVKALAAVGEDELFVGGGFMTYGGADRQRVARVRRDGTLAEGFSAKVKYEVNAILPLEDGRVVVAGEFNTVNDVRLNHVALLRPEGGVDEEFGFEIGTDLAVHALVAGPGKTLVMGGAFTSVQGEGALRVSRVLMTGAKDPAFDTRSGPDAEVDAVVVDGMGRTVIGGRFGRVEGRARGGVARLSETGRLDLGFAAGAGANGAVRALALDGRGRVLVAGEFSQFDGRPAGRIVRLTETGTRDETFRVGMGPGADDAIQAVLPRTDGTIWVAGRFVTVDGWSRNRVARLREDGEVDPTFDPGSGPNDGVMALAERADGGLVLGGVFTEVMGVPRGGVAVVLPSLPEAVRFVWADRGPEGVRWYGAGWPRQRYSVERSTDLRDWQLVEEVGSDDGRLNGTLPMGAGDTGFVRLHRRLE